MKLTIIHSLVLIAIITFLSIITYNYVKAVFIENERKNLVKKFIHRRGRMWMGLYENIVIEISPDGSYKVLRDPYNLEEYKEGIVRKGDEYFLIIREGNLLLGKEITPVMISLRNLKAFLILISLVGVAGSMFVGFGMSNIFLKPLRKILSDLKKILPEDLSIRLPYSKSRDELYFLVSRINEMLDRIERAYRAQERFVSDVSHELRTPVTTLLGYIKMLKRWGKENERVLKESLDAMENTAEDMKDLIESLLLMTKPDVNIPVEKVDLEKFVQSLVNKWKKRYSREIRLKVIKNEIVKTNPEYLEIMLNALVVNAIKYSEGPVDLVIDNRRVSVIDRGPGIPEGKQEEIFQRFRRLSREKGGHGIGLSIVKELAERLNIEVKLKSKIGEGSEFILNFRREG